MNGSSTKMVIDIATDRIIWFGPADFPLEETHIEGAAIAFYDGPLPTGMRATNAWNYKLQSQKIVPPAPRTIPTPETPVDTARRVLLKTMRTMVNSHRAAHGVPQSVAEFLLRDKEQILSAIDVTQRTEEVLTAYSARVQAATQGSDLITLKDEFTEKLNEIKA